MPTRNLTPAMRTALERRERRLIEFVWLDFAGDPLYAHNDLGDIEFSPGIFDIPDDTIWHGMGNVGEIDPIDEDFSLAADNYAVSWRSTTEVINHLRSLDFVGRNAGVWEAARDLTTGTLVANPRMLIFGKMVDPVFPGFEGGTAVIEIRDERANIGSGQGLWWSQAQQKAGDNSLRDLATIGTRVVKWGPQAPGARPTTRIHRPSPDDEYNDAERNQFR